jgi:hypothetical protein
VTRRQILRLERQHGGLVLYEVGKEGDVEAHAIDINDDEGLYCTFPGGEEEVDVVLDLAAEIDRRDNTERALRLELDRLVAICNGARRRGLLTAQEVEDLEAARKASA